MRISDWSSDVCSSDLVCILDDEGSLDLVWHMQLEVASRHSEPVLDVYQAMTGNLSAERFRHWSVDENSLDLYIVIKSNERDDQALAQLETELAPLLPEGWRCHRNGNNLAYLPPWLSKRHAARYLIAKYPSEPPANPNHRIGDTRPALRFLAP